ncbi:hypothetical protein QUA79_01450 [Microcoleus sp. F8-D1]
MAFINEREQQTKTFSAVEVRARLALTSSEQIEMRSPLSHPQS